MMAAVMIQDSSQIELLKCTHGYMCCIVPTAPQVNSSVSPTESVKSIRTQLISSSLWTVSGYGIAQILRFGNNLVLTRILSPKLFGVMALVQAIITGLSFVTDVGIGPSVIQNKKSEDARFLGTAWTLQILRSAGIWIACCLLAWPASVIYREPDMLFALRSADNHGSKFTNPIGRRYGHPGLLYT